MIFNTDITKFHGHAEYGERQDIGLPTGIGAALTMWLETFLIQGITLRAWHINRERVLSH